MSTTFALPLHATLLFVTPLLLTAATPQASITELPTPSAQSLPSGLDLTADGSGVFYAELTAGKIALVQNLQLVREYTLPPGAAPNIVKLAAPDTLWFTDTGNAAIGLLNPQTGAVLEFKTPSGVAPNFLQIAHDHSLWFSEPSGVGHFALSGEITEWRITLEKSDSHIEQLSIDPLGNIWFTELNYDGVGPLGTNYVRRLDPSANTVRSYAVPTFGGTPAGVQAASSGHIWVSEYFAGKIALLDPQAAPYTTDSVTPTTGLSTESHTHRQGPTSTHSTDTVTRESGVSHYVTPTKTQGWLEWLIPVTGSNIEDMRIAQSGSVYFEDDNGYLGHLDPIGNSVIEYAIPSPNSGYYNIALNGCTLWFSEAGAFVPVPTKVGVLTVH